MPKLVVLGNHDYHSDKEEEICAVLSEVGVRILEGDSAVVSVNGERLGVAGIKGFGGGFPGGMVTAFGEPETKAFARHGMEAAEGATARGVPVRNVAYPVINQPYLVIELNGEPLE